MKFLIILIILSFTQIELLSSQTTAEQLKKIVGSDRDVFGYFGQDVAIDGNYAVVGASGQDGTGAAFFFEYSNGNWNLVQKVSATDATSGDNFGRSVSISGNYAVIGAHYQDGDINNLNTLSSAGAAYVFERTSGTWTQVKKLVASDRAANANFGFSVGISGNYIIIGAQNEAYDHNGANFLNYAGAVYFFERDGTWSQVQKVVNNSDRNSFGYYGWSVGIDGTYCIVGAKQNNSDENGANIINSAGAAYFLERNSGTWTQVKKVTGTSRALQEFFGESVAINGNFAIVGARDEEDDEDGGNLIDDAGAAYVYERVSGTWTYRDKLDASDRAQDNRFGFDVDISSNGLAIVSAHENGTDENNQNLSVYTGAVYIFEKSGNEWPQVKKIVASDRAASDYFGRSNAIYERTIFVGANEEDHDEDGLNTVSGAGSAYIFSILSAPTISNITKEASVGGSATFTADITVGGSSTTVTYEYGTSSGNYSSTTTASIISSDGESINVLTSLSDNQEYFLRVRAENSYTYTYSNETSFTYTNTPLNHTSTFTLARNEITQVVFNIQSAQSIGASGYIILYKQGSSFTGVPSNGGNYSVGTTIGDATVGAIVTSASAVEATVAGLTKDTQYHFKIFPFNWNGSDITTAVYKTDGTVPSLTVVTAPTLGEWGMIAFVGLMGLGGVFYMRKRIA